MKKILSLILMAVMTASIFAGCAKATAETESTESAAFTDDMKIPYTCDLHEYGADSVERDGDHKDSPYFKSPDFYNMESTDSLTILTNFKTQQQTSEWSCGVSSALMIMNWYDMLGDNNEETLAKFRSNGLAEEATSTTQMIEMFDGVGGFETYSVLDCKDNVYDVFTLEFVEKTLKEGKPIAIGWNDWGGHWQVIIGYDNMGTETQQDDVIIVADPYDTTDHNQDGYGIYPAERFLYNFTFYDFFDEESGEPNDMCFIVASPKK